MTILDRPTYTAADWSRPVLVRLGPDRVLRAVIRVKGICYAGVRNAPGCTNQIRTGDVFAYWSNCSICLDHVVGDAPPLVPVPQRGKRSWR